MSVSTSKVNMLEGNFQKDEIARIFKIQQAHKRKMAATDVKDRIKRLKTLCSAILKRRPELQKAMMDDFRKHATEVDLTEIYPSTSEIKHTISNLAEWMQPEKVETPMVMLGTQSQIRYEARGVCLIVSPWNYPINLTFIPLASAIAAGNTAIVKPSEFTPNTSRVMAELIREIFPENEVAIFEGDHTVAQELLKLKFDHIFFTGSPAIGKIVMRAASEHLTSVTLELGGKSPVVVDETASIADAAKKIAWGKLLNKGQTCVAPDYVLVHESKTEELVQELHNQVSKMYGDTEEEVKENPSYCRIVNSGHHTRIENLLHDAVEKGAEIEFGGEVDSEERYISPTVLTAITDDMKIMQEEIFGPLLPVLPYSDLEDVIQYINAREKPLALYIFSKKNSTVDHLLENTSCGGVTVNDTLLHFSNPNLPFGGVNNSGIGQCHGVFGFRAFSHAKGVMRQKTKLAANQLMYPPYTDRVGKLSDFTIKYF